MNNHSVLIADSGSTKTDWAFMGRRVQTQGINPFHQDEDTIRGILKDELLPQLTSDIRHLTSILFYGSGVRPELEEKMQRLLQEAFPQAEPASWERGPTRVCMTASGLWRTRHQWAIYWVMKVVEQYLG